MVKNPPSDAGVAGSTWGGGQPPAATTTEPACSAATGCNQRSSCVLQLGEDCMLQWRPSTSPQTKTKQMTRSKQRNQELLGIWKTTSEYFGEPWWERVLWQGPIAPALTRVADYILKSKHTLFLPPLMGINSRIRCPCVPGLFSLFHWSILLGFWISFGRFLNIWFFFKLITYLSFILKPKLILVPGPHSEKQDYGHKMIRVNNHLLIGM